jgi:hypothetical protein
MSEPRTGGARQRRSVGLMVRRPGCGRFSPVRRTFLGRAATIYRLCEQGELHHIRVSNAIRIAPVDLEAFPEQEQEDDMSANAPAERCALQLLCSPDHGAGWQTAPETCSRLKGRPERSLQSNRADH